MMPDPATGRPDAIADALRVLLEADGRALLLTDRANGETKRITADLAAAPAGALPMILRAGEATMRAATGQGIGLRLDTDPHTLFGYRVAGFDAPASTALLVAVDALYQIGTTDAFPLNDLLRVYDEAVALVPAAREDTTPAPVRGPSP